MRKNLPILLLLLTLLSFYPVFGQEGTVVYDFRDGTVVSAGGSSDGTLTLSGNYGYHSTNYGLNMKVAGEIAIQVGGSCTVRFVGSKHSGLTMSGTAATEGDLGTQNTKVVNDLSDVFDFVYSGAAGTLTFKLLPGSGNDLYLPEISVIPAQAGAAVASPEKNIVYYFDLRDGSIIPTDTDGKSDLSVGLMEVLVGTSNAYGYNGTQHGSVLKTGNQIRLKVAGNTRIRVGGSIYSNGTITVSSETGNFDQLSQASATTGNFGNDGSTVDFLYAGEAGTVNLAFSGTNYIPYIELAPVPFEVVLTPFRQKAGSIRLNDTDIGITTGERTGEAAQITLSEGTVLHATDELASILINLGGKKPADFSPEFSGDIQSVQAAGDSLLITFSDSTSNPLGYILDIKDNSVQATAEAGKTYTYHFFDGSELPQISYQELRYPTFVSRDGILTINSNNADAALQFGYHDATHGGVFFPGNSFEFPVSGDAIVTFIVDTYGRATDAIFEIRDQAGNLLGTIAGQNIGGADGFPSNFAYEGPKGRLVATLLSESFPTAEIYIHGMSIENAPATEPSNGKTDVWDFGAEALDTLVYNNQLSVEAINAWYDPSIAVGSKGNVLPGSFSAGVLSWTGGGNDRLRTINTEITRYDENISSAPGYTGRIYVNSGANSGRYLSLALDEDDEVTLITKTDAGGTINFEYVADPETQKEQVPISSNLTELKFVAKAAGSYRIYDTQGKPSYYRIYRKDAQYIDLSGAIDLAAAPGIPADYGLVFTNDAGKQWMAAVNGSSYAIRLPAGNHFTVSLSDANGYIVASGENLELTDSIITHDLVLAKVELFTMSGAIEGLGSLLSSLQLSFDTDPSENRIYVPKAEIDSEGGTYSVSLESGVAYTISAEGVNDYFIPDATVTLAGADTVRNIVFEIKPLYAVDIQTSGLTDEAKAGLELTFSNLNEVGYVYTFIPGMDIMLRSGVYAISQSGVDEFPVELALTSNLTISDQPAAKNLTFNPVTRWSFDDKVIANGTPAYKGLLLSGDAYNEVAKGHLATKAGAEIKVPADPGEKITVSYYYAANFSIDGGTAVTTNSQSTSVVESVDYIYQGDASGYVTLTAGGDGTTTYFTEISRSPYISYAATLTVGPDKDYQSINAALEAVRNMDRAEGERVTILIDPGNYEEMLVIDRPDITLKNAAVVPDIALLNKGVDIGAGAVRITSYYGHGYHYYSMNNQKWDAEVLRVNKENGYYSYGNKGAGTTNQSYWNATVVVFANGFEADDIIFENSFNQYISQKESEDIVVMWEVGGKGIRPTDYGNTAVQDRTYVERAAALAIANNADKVVLNRCRVVGRQDSFFGGSGARVVVYKGALMGAVDYIFGAMTAVMYKTDLVMNTSDANSDAAYLTAAQQSSGRGYLMYECRVTSTEPEVETASLYRAKPGYFGRPWLAGTSEVVFYNTTVETSNYPGYEGKSLIQPLGWQNTLGGESSGMYEFGTTEVSGEDNSTARASWATLLSEAVLADGTAILPFNFTKGNDDWDPLPVLIEKDIVSSSRAIPQNHVKVYSANDRVYLSNIDSKTQVQVFQISGQLLRAFPVYGEYDFSLPAGIWVIKVDNKDGTRAVKVITF